MIRLTILACLLLTACTETEPPPGPELLVNNERVRIEIGGHTVLEYQLEAQLPDSLAEHYRRSGFIHPVYSPARRLVTDDFPVGHTHQHGIFTAWTNTTFRGEFLDFWNQHKDLGTVEHVELTDTLDTPEIAGFTATLRHLSLTEGEVLREEWKVRVHDSADPYVWDLLSVQTNTSTDTLYLEKYLYGGLGVRGSAEWNEVDSLSFLDPATFLTSEGVYGDSGNHTRPEWTAVYGLTSSKRGNGVAGIAVYPHPENFRGPQFVRVHPTMPYLSITPVVEEGFSIAPGEVYEARYRFVVFDGEPNGLDRFGWGSYPESRGVHPE